LLLWLAAAGCVGVDDQDSQFPAWILPLPSGTTLLEHTIPDPDSRPSARIEIQEDLVIAGFGEDSSAPFYEASRVDVDDSGNIYVLDTGNSQVHVFGANGEYQRSLGAEGQGPGELQRPIGVAVSGNRVFVTDAVQARVATWQGGELAASVSLSPLRPGAAIFGAANGGFVADVYERMDDGQEVRRSVLYSPTVSSVRIYATLPVPTDFFVRSLTAPARVRFPSIQSPPAHVVAEGDHVFISNLADYQIFAFDLAGSVRWALRVPWLREPFSDEHRNAVLAEWARGLPDPDASGVTWPSRLPALSGLLVDGHSHLYAFPYMFSAGDDSPRQSRPVDVYSAAGAHVFSGYMRTIDWTAAQGDFIYAIRVNPNSGGTEAVRYRLTEPF